MGIILKEHFQPEILDSLRLDSLIAYDMFFLHRPFQNICYLCLTKQHIFKKHNTLRESDEPQNTS